MTRTAPAHPEMVLQIGHGHPLEDIAWSHDSKMVASVAYDGLKLWTRDGTLIRSFVAPKDGMSESGGKIAFSPDGKKLFYSAVDSYAYTYAVPGGQLLKVLYGAEYSGDGTRIIKRREGAITFLDARTGKLVGSIKVNGINAELSLSPDGRRVVVGGRGWYGDGQSTGKLTVWDIVRGKALSVLSDEYGAQKTSAVFGPVAWSPDSKTLVTGGNDLSVTMSNGSNNFHPNALKFWHVQNGKRWGVWRGHNSIDVSFIDAQRLFSENAVWDIKSGRRLVQLTQKTGIYSEEPDYPLLVSPDRKLLLSGDGGPSAILEWDLTRGKLVRRFPGAAASGFRTFAWSHDGKVLAGGGDTHQLWSARSGRFIRILPGTSYTQQIRFLPDNSLVATNLQWAYFWTPQGKIIRKWPPVKDSKTNTTEYSDGVSVSPDGKFFLTKGNVWANEDRDILHIWAADGTKIHTIKGFQDTYHNQLGWLDDSHFMQAGKGSIKLWNATTGEIERTFIAPGAPEAMIWSAVSSADGKVIAAQIEGNAQTNNTLLVWGINGDLRHIITGTASKPLALAPDGAFLAANGNNALQIFDIRTRNVTPEKGAPGKPLRTLALRSPLLGYDSALNWSPDGANLVVSEDGRVKLFDPHSGALRVTLYSFRTPRPRLQQDTSSAPDAWLALTPDGFYDASPGADRFIRWRVGNRIFPAARFAKQFKNPAKVQAALRP